MAVMQSNRVSAIQGCIEVYGETVGTFRIYRGYPLLRGWGSTVGYNQRKF